LYTNSTTTFSTIVSLRTYVSIGTGLTSPESNYYGKGWLMQKYSTQKYTKKDLMIGNGGIFKTPLRKVH